MIQFDLRRIALFICLAFCFSARSQTVLSAGDIAFTGYNSDDNTVNGPASNDDFSFIILRNILAGTTIYFTDFGWCSNTNAFQTPNPCGATTGAVSDGIVQWTATSNMSYGSQVTIRCRFTPSANFGTATGFQATFNVASEFVNLVIGGDQLFAYQGTLSSPNLIAGMGMNGAWDASLSNCTFTSSNCVIPPALNSSNYAFNIFPEVDNARLKTSISLTGNAANDRAAIHNAANWDVNDVTAFALPAPITPLPVNFVRFSALRNNGSVKLVWDVAGEINLHEYKVQRSTNGSIWEDLTAIPATGSSSYTWTDAYPATGKNFYRICSVDMDGRLKYTQVVSSDAGVSASRISASPNPFREYADVNINLAEGSELSMQLIGTNGQVIWEYHSSLSAGSHVIRINEIARFAAGVYQLVVRSTNGTKYQKISILKQ
jgi:hypothetical protein